MIMHVQNYTHQNIYQILLTFNILYLLTLYIILFLVIE